MQRNQVPTAAKIRYLERDVKIRKEIIPIQGDPVIKQEMEYHLEVVAAILADYKQMEKMEDQAADWQEGRR